MSQNFDILTITGATAGGKTTLAAHLALRNNGEIISADSRQVYRGMDIGTGKDLGDYVVNGTPVPYHLIDIADAGEKYNVFEFQNDFFEIYSKLKLQNKLPILCGGTGMYIDSVLRGYKLISVPPDEKFRQQAENMTDAELISILEQHKHLHNISDTSNRKRLIRAAEIALYYAKHGTTETEIPKLNSQIFQVEFDRETQRQRITQRLQERLQSGMIEEVKALLDKKIPAETLVYYGLEYKFITQYILGELTYAELFTQLEIAIHQFAKRQMTWFRKMEKDGFVIHKIDGHLPLEEKLSIIEQFLHS